MAFEYLSAMQTLLIRAKYELLLGWGLRFDENGLALARKFVGFRVWHRESEVSIFF